MNEERNNAAKPTVKRDDEEYEISIPFEENNFEQTDYYSQSENTLDEISEPAPSSYVVVTNLRTQLQISLEKNSWLQKRIEDLEEERDFLRCQLDRFIAFTKGDQGEGEREEVPRGSRGDSRSYSWERRRDNDLSSSSRRSGSSMLSRRSSLPAAPSQPPPPRHHPSSQHGSRTQSSQQHQGSSNTSNSATSTTASYQQQSTAGNQLNQLPGLQGKRALKGDGMGGLGFGANGDDLLGEEEEGLWEEEEVMSGEEAMSDRGSGASKRGMASANGHHSVKRRRVIRISRERQRVKDPAGVLFRYRKILLTYQKLKNMTKAFQHHGVDRNTVASTTPIAELLLVAPEKIAEVGEFDPAKERLLDYARRCYTSLDEETSLKVQAFKKNNLLLPISYRFKR
ncbi:coiled-coil domain-containing protein 106-like isoform X2 [Polyodon spathula]|uniref:coiled-coil domain-containing protein 106-like isoform X2 n=1 Tax=Polyodon spathula TaxID=7913 RepID=UPI001B7EBB75|nr:coiled-coil domain-containing protein 106-like isoform X2 [Polyodon spathula]